MEGIVANALPTEAQLQLNEFWPKALEDVRNLRANDFKTQELPLARIKKIMKLDDDVKMISAEAPALFAKAAELFISELTLRAWIHAEDNKRRTLQRNDIAMAISKYDQFDFLIDIVPREEVRPSKREDEMLRSVVSTDHVQYYFQMGNQPQQQQQQQTVQTVQTAPVVQQPIQILTGNTVTQQPQMRTATVGGVSGLMTQQATPPKPAPAAAAAAAAQPTPMQVYTQVVTASGEVQQIPIQLTPAQIQAITQQMQGKMPNQPIVIQAPIDPSVADASGQFNQLFQLPMYAQQENQSDGEQGQGE